MGQYCRGVSDFDPDVWGNAWAEDARWIFPGADSVVGRDAIVERFREIRAIYPLCVQQVTSEIIEVEGFELRVSGPTSRVTRLRA